MGDDIVAVGFMSAYGRHSFVNSRMRDLRTSEADDCSL